MNTFRLLFVVTEDWYFRSNRQPQAVVVRGAGSKAASAEEVTSFYRQRGLVLEMVRGCGRRHGCNEFLFRRS